MADISLLVSDDDATNAKPWRQHDLTGQVIHEVVVEACIATTIDKQKKWRVRCLSCGGAFARTTYEINQYRRDRSTVSCRTCFEELLGGARNERRIYWHMRLKQFWEQYGILYGASYHHAEIEALREAFFADEGPPMEHLRPEDLTVAVAGRKQPHTARIQNVFELYPVRAGRSEAFNCEYCSRLHTKGFACTCCRTVVCCACVENETHACEGSGHEHDESAGWVTDRHGQLVYDWYAGSQPEFLKRIAQSCLLSKVKVTKDGGLATFRRA